MATALLITPADIVKKTALNGNVDTDLFIQFVQIAQDIHIQRYLGTDLLVKIQSLISASTLDQAGNAAYKSLLLTYVKPMLIHWAMVEYLPFAPYTVANKGVYKHGAENSESINDVELYKLVEKERSIAQSYTQRFIDYMCFNNSTYPEYNSNSNSDVYPDKDVNLTGWVL
jgi:hypothetical protein